ncbi:S8 family serine peptidase [Streptomyces spinosus]|uniref:S8 family serine peptidase n=1 Tax=Streptomyces spinosus TaxID=2872623 RepID=UPI001CECE8F6|nr:S8 family serine peptidase [Streptomyces spinosus]
MTGHRTAALLLGAGTLAALIVAPAGAAPTGPAAGRPGPAVAGPVEKVTLITGDTVSYRRTGGTVEVVGTAPAPRRREAAFARFTEKGHTYVVPQDAWGALTRGEVDRALFDITGLAAQRLDDGHTGRIGVLVTGRPGSAPKTATPSTAEVTRTLPRLGIRALSTRKSDATALWAALTGEKGGAGARRAAPAHGTKIWLDGVVRPTLDVSVPLVGAPSAWKHGYEGDGVKVAVLDTGIATGHPDLKGKVDAAKNFTDAAGTGDHVGHGTHVASTITGNGAASGGRYRGVAPGARLLNGKVLDDTGRGSDSQVLAGMEWAVQQGAKVVNMSLGGEFPSDGTDVLSSAVNELSASSGALFVVAAGNSGTPESVSSPGAADAALTVASTTKRDTLSSFSSRGPRIGDFGLKPEISAPGEDITAARAPGAFPDAPGDTHYVTLSGTSMATPHVAGAAAILAGEHPGWTGQQIKAALTGSATVLKGIDVFGNGAGRLDVARAAAQPVRALTPSLGLGRLSWPHDPAKPAGGKVTYANDGDTPVTLALSLSVTGTAGAPAPEGLSSAPASLTVPAHGTASATVRVSAGSGSTGSWEGRLTAAAGDTRVVTPVAADVLDRTGTMTVRVLDRSGQPIDASGILMVLQNDATGAVYFPAAGEGSGTGDALSVAAEVPVGTYRLLGVGLADESPGVSTTYFARDGLRVDGDRAVTLDAREAQPVTAELNDPAARPEIYTANVTLRSVVAGTAQTSDFSVVSNYPHRYVQSTEAIPGTTFSYSAAWAPPHNRVTTVGEDPYEVGDVEDPRPEGYEGDVTARLADIGEETDPDRIGDVGGKVVLIAPDVRGEPVDPPTAEQFAPLVKALRDRGAALVLTYDYLGDTGALPVLYLIRPEDVQGLRDRAAAGQDRVHVRGRPVTPTSYALYDSVGTALPHGQAWHFDRAALARVDALYRNPAGGRHVSSQALTFTDTTTGLTDTALSAPTFPQRRVEYFTPGVLWGAETSVGLTADWTSGTSEVTAPTRYLAGQRGSTAWGTAPFAPRLPRVVRAGPDGEPLPTAYRQGNRLVTRIPVFSAADPGHLVLPETDSEGTVREHGATRLFRGTTQIGANGTPGVGAFDLPAAPGTYRLVVTGTRPSALSPKVRSEWTFTTGRTDGAVRTPLDLLDLGFVLPLDRNDTARAGRRLTGSVTVRHQPGASGTSPVREVAVDVSYDDGKSWRRAVARAAGDDRWTLVIPAGGRPGGHVTLRANAVDRAGDRVRQTVTRAYGLR